MKNQNQFTPKAFVIRYWDRVIKNNLPKPSFILSKASPLSAADASSFANYASANTLSTKLPEFCSAANLLCSLDINPQSYRKGVDLDKKLSFASYGITHPFEDYIRKGLLFPIYTKSSSNNSITSLGKNSFRSGMFFREKMLQQGMVMHMPNIRDKLPERSFLPRSILIKLPFASSKLDEMKQFFKVSKNSSMEKMIVNSLRECERVPSKGEVKRCVGSLEDMIDFATSILGSNVTVRSTENVNGSNKNVMLSQVRGINHGKVKEFVSCHQTMFPYLLYYCHSVPKVRVYEADLLDPQSKVKINRGVAICHLDTTAWSPTHGAFVALGSGPGRIEVCHWIFENDLIWTIAD
ncbi:hypothetical protein TSUD_187640 [Trifolium subterraneum]|uniref:BURP domain-containing protein n=1 Tax=Trifolium subterraneum TaxID=3900 RepID=A0A2Z6P3A3_TRISU|nr:hypothetical protein TSUD_187640 [Trifolium subterraneum]